MSIVHQKDKRSGITYVYESKARWDKDKKQSRSIRRYIYLLPVFNRFINKFSQFIHKVSRHSK